MLKKTMTYKDFNGEERTEELFFNLSKAELVEWEYMHEGGMTGTLRRAIAAKDNQTIMMAFKDLLFKAYGEKSPDGKRFIKSPEISKAFSETEAYSDLFMELFTSPEYAAEFIKGIVPQEG